MASNKEGIADEKKRDFIKLGALGLAAGASIGLLSKIPFVNAVETVKGAQLENYTETVNAIGSTGGGIQDIDLNLGNVVTATVDTSTNTFTFSNPAASGISSSFTLILTNGGSKTVHWPASVEWPEGTKPTLTTSGVDMINFTTTDSGTKWYGFANLDVSEDTSGQLWAWGWASSGKLGDNTTNNKSSPVQIGSLTDWASISACQYHSFAIKTDGTLWAWGQASSGKLGNETTTPDLSSPVQIGALTNWASVSGGEVHSLAIKTDGTLWAWGLNTSYGRLGDGTKSTDRSSPIQIGSLKDWASVSAGNNHSLAVKTNGTLWAWGSGQGGRLGHGSANSRSSPVQIGSLKDWALVSASGNFSHAIKTDGTLWAWGTNTTYGYLGDGTKVDKSSPVQIGALTNWISVNSISRHSLAVKTNGTLWAWGENANGRVGDGTIIKRSSPVQIGSLSDWVSAKGGGSHSHAVKTDGALWAWGDAGFGQLGDGTTTSRSSPVQVGALTDWAAINISSGAGHFLAIKG